MSYSFLPSLQHMAVIKITTALWNQADIRYLIVKSYPKSINKPLEWPYGKILWEEIEEKVMKKVSLLPQLGLLKEKILGAVKPLGIKILKWKAYTEEFCNIQFCFEDFPKEISWTPHGTVDKKQTAEAMVRDLSIPESTRFRLACLYCIEAIWDKLHTLPMIIYRENWELDAFVAFWIYNITGDETELNIRIPSYTGNRYRYIFRKSVYFMNEVAAEYYFNKLTPREKEESLSDVALQPYCISDFGIYRFLLLHMSERQQLRMLEKYAFDVLKSLLAWPWQEFFMDMANRVRHFLKPCYSHYNLLVCIVYKTAYGYKDYCYRELFGQFWKQSPATHKKYLIIHEFKICYLLSAFLELKDEKNILLILNDASLEEKENIIFGVEGILICKKLVESGEQDLLKFFVSNCISSKEKMIKFKSECERKKITTHGSSRRRVITSDVFFQLIDELIEKMH